MNCIQSAEVDSQHAVIDYSETDGYFVLQDLNSSRGTFVNDCRVHNAAVRLASGDTIRFGISGPVYTFLTDTAPKVSIVFFICMYLCLFFSILSLYL